MVRAAPFQMFVAILLNGTCWKQPFHTCIISFSIIVLTFCHRCDKLIEDIEIKSAFKWLIKQSVIWLICPAQIISFVSEKWAIQEHAEDPPRHSISFWLLNRGKNSASQRGGWISRFYHFCGGETIKSNPGKKTGSSRSGAGWHRVNIQVSRAHGPKTLTFSFLSRHLIGADMTLKLCFIVWNDITFQIMFYIIVDKITLTTAFWWKHRKNAINVNVTHFSRYSMAFSVSAFLIFHVNQHWSPHYTCLGVVM